MSDPDCPQKAPFVRDEDPGRRAWCACGRSAGQPFCDGSHAGTEFRPMIVDLPQAGRVAWCGCKRSLTPPYCDGSHKRC